MNIKSVTAKGLLIHLFFLHIGSFYSLEFKCCINFLCDFHPSYYYIHFSDLSSLFNFFFLHCLPQNVSIGIVGKDLEFTIYDDDDVSPFLEGLEERPQRKAQVCHESQHERL